MKNKHFNFTRSDWSLLSRHKGFTIFLRFAPSQLDVERAGMAILNGQYGQPVLL